MISCWFSRHCFSLSSVSVSLLKMETVCKINGQAQMEGPLGCPQPGLLSCPGTNACSFPPGSCLVPRPWVLMSAPGVERWFSAACGQKDIVGSSRACKPDI